jgi:hypothetical protein
MVAWPGSAGADLTLEEIQRRREEEVLETSNIQAPRLRVIYKQLTLPTEKRSVDNLRLTTPRAR